MIDEICDVGLRNVDHLIEGFATRCVLGQIVVETEPAAALAKLELTGTTAIGLVGLGDPAELGAALFDQVLQSANVERGEVPDDGVVATIPAVGELPLIRMGRGRRYNNSRPRLAMLDVDVEAELAEAADVAERLVRGAIQEMLAATGRDLAGSLAEYLSDAVDLFRVVGVDDDEPRTISGDAAEARDVDDIGLRIAGGPILDGADACMLSGETAIGKYPREAVEMMNRIALATEGSMAGRPPREMARPRADGLQEVTRAVVRGAGAMAHTLEAKLVVVASHSGRTALALSQQRSFVPTVGVSTSEVTLRKMCLYWGVTPLRGAPASDIEQLIRHTDAWSVAAGLARPGDRVVIVGGSHLTAGPGGREMAAGVHDIVIVHQVEGAEA